MSNTTSLPQELLQPQKLYSRDEILIRPSPIPKQPGIYAWYISNLPEIVPTADCHNYDSLPLVYVGISTNLRKRIRRHFNGPTNVSTLRRTLGSLLVNQLNLTPEMISKAKFNFGDSEEALNHWLAQNGSVVWLAHPNLRELERTFLNSHLSLPLNIESNKDHPFRPTLKRLRQAVKAKASGAKDPSSNKTFFPITRSTPSAEALTPLLEITYDLKNVRCHLIKGLILHTYHVASSDGRYIFRIYPHARRTKSEISEELAFLQHLNRHNIPVSVPLPTQDGRLHFPFNAPEGPRQAALFTYAPGQPFEDRTSTENIHAFGRLLAQLHQAAETFPQTGYRQPFTYQTLIDHPLTYLEENLPDRQTDWTYLRTIAPKLQSTLIKTLPTNPPYTTYIHGDLDSNNIHVTQDNPTETQFTLFDFDLCGPGLRSFDIAVFLIDESHQTTETFLAGYQSISPLSSAEIQAIPHLQISQMIWLLALRASYINEWGRAFLPNRFINNMLQSVKKLIN